MAAVYVLTEELLDIVTGHFLRLLSPPPLSRGHIRRSPFPGKAGYNTGAAFLRLFYGNQVVWVLSLDEGL